MSGMSDVLIWIALAGGTAAAAAALYGHYYVLPGWLTGPEICRLEDGGCAVLFRSPRSALLGVPNATLGLALYALLATGLIIHAPAPGTPDDDAARRGDERLSRLQPDRQRPSVPHLLGGTHLERWRCSQSCSREWSGRARSHRIDGANERPRVSLASGAGRGGPRERPPCAAGAPARSRRSLGGGGSQ